jgi:hypothetical protein
MNFSNFFKHKNKTSHPKTTENILNQIIQIKDENVSNIIYKLRENGWSKIGEGSFGTVLTHPNEDYVLKIFKDSCYDMFLRFLERHQNNPHIVKVHRILIQPNYNSEDVGIVAIEKLERINRSQWRETIAENFGYYLNNIPNISKKSFDNIVDSFAEKVKKTKTAENSFYKNEIKNGNSISYHRSIIAQNERQIRRIDFFIENYLPLLRTIYDLSVYLELNEKHCRLDLHKNNYMIRPSTGEIVITDPIA